MVIAVLKPPPSSPRRLAAGTWQSSKNTAAVSAPRMPILPCMGRASSPGVPFSTMNAVVPAAPRLRSCDANTIITSASLPLVMNILAPRST